MLEDKKTNANKIRSMSDDELADFLYKVEHRRAIDGGGAKWKSKQNTLSWLQQTLDE